MNQESNTRGVSRNLFLIGLLSAAVATGASLMLVLQHIKGLALWGCGLGGHCEEAAKSVWGKLPGTNWPVSFVGLAYFMGILVAWILSRRHGVSNALRNMVRLGVVVSLGFVAVIALQKHLCIYCMVFHAANFVFWLVIECSPKSATANRAGTTVAVTFIAASLALGGVELTQKKSVNDRGKNEHKKSTDEMISGSKGQERPAEQSVMANPADKGKSPSQMRWPKGFTGRHRMGPEKAPIRIVLLSDFQCPDCQQVEQDIRTMLAIRKDVSVAFKHFPMCKDCNKYIFGSNLHPNACWAARASETASVLGGEDAFWKMHHWLFDKKGKFETTDELSAGITSIGLDPKAFIALMSDPNQEPMKRVLEDVEDGQWLGLHYTPMVFINGVELRGVFLPNAVPRAVDALTAQHPPEAGCENDFPPPAEDKYITDWRERPLLSIPPAQVGWPRGPADAKVQVVVWGDLAEVNSSKVDKIVRAYAEKHKNVRYDFRHFPANPTCNPSCEIMRNEKACLAHKAAVAAGMLDGADAYWKMHIWLMENQGTFSEETLKQNAYQMGLDVNALLQKMESPEVAKVISTDAAMGKRYNLTSVPTVYVNGHFVPRILRGSDVIVEAVLEEAAK